MIRRNNTPLQRTFLAIFFLFGVIVSSKIQLHRIFGLNLSFSLLTVFGPVVNAFLSTPMTILVIFGARIIQILAGISKAKTIISWLMYLPILSASYYFGRLTKRAGDPQKYLIPIPITCIVLFVMHPIGRKVWYFSLYWLIPIVIALISQFVDYRIHDVPKIYLYALASTFIDHCVGSVLFLYAYNIPAIYWDMAIPFVILERLLFAGGITLIYMFLKKAIPPLREIYIFGFVVERERELAAQRLRVNQ